MDEGRPSRAEVVNGREARTLPALLRSGLEAFGDNEIVVTLDERVTLADLGAASRRLSRALVVAGMGKGSRIGAQFSYGADFLVAFLAAARIGAVFVPLSTAYKPPELRKTVRHADLALLLTPRTLLGVDREDFLEEAFPGLTAHDSPPLRLTAAPYLRAIWVDGPSDRSWATSVALRAGEVSGAPPLEVTDELLDEMEAEVSPADAAVTIYTSGTTAEPKGVVHTQGALARKGWTFVDTMGITAADRVFCGMPFFWVGGLAQVVLPSLCVGSTMLCLEKPDPEPSLDLMEREQLTRLAGWPGVTGPILNHPSVATRKLPDFATPRSTKGGRTGGGLGMTETLAGYSSLRPVKLVPEGERGICMGMVNPGMELRIVEVDGDKELPDGDSGSIQVRGFCLMVGLHKHEREETFTPEGWYDTGDKGYLKDGLLYFEGRYKEMIKTSGSNVAPPEVESVLQSFAEVAEAHVLGVPDAERGEIVAAAVVPAAGQTIDPVALVERARLELSNYKVPRKVVVLQRDELPSLANGKPDRLAIRKLLSDA